MMPIIDERTCREAAPDTPPHWLDRRLRSLFAAVVVESPCRFRFGDLAPFDLENGNCPPVGTAPPAGAPAETFFGFGANPLVEPLWQVIYNYCYAREFCGTPALLPSGPIESADSDFLWTLRKANASRARWDHDWTIDRVHDDFTLHLEKAGNRCLARPGSYALAEGRGQPPRVGEKVSRRCSSELLDMQPGFYFALGETVGNDDDDSHLSRFYFHVGAGQTAWLLGLLTRSFNRCRIPYRIKCLANPRLYDRCDPMVLYLAKRYLSPALRILADFRAELEQKLLPGVPLGAKPLLPGLGAADEPGNGSSFGQTRSYILAQSILDAAAAGLDAPETRLAYASRRFRQLGLSLARPHLSEGSADLYEWPELSEGEDF